MTVKTFKPSAITIHFTDQAIAHFESTLQKTAQAKGVALGTKTTGCSGYSYVVEVVSSLPDKAIEASSNAPFTVWLFEDSIAMLNGLEIDFVAKDFGLGQLAYHNPNESARCGCGESFSIETPKGANHEAE